VSRKRKFKIGDVCFWTKHIAGAHETTAISHFGVIVDYRQDGTGRGMYCVVRVLHPVNGAPFGESVWVDSHNLLQTKYQARKTVPSRYKANKRLVERGCECNCCAHEAIPLSEIRNDGSFRWEELDVT